MPASHVVVGTESTGTQGLTWAPITASNPLPVGPGSAAQITANLPTIATTAGAYTTGQALGTTQVLPVMRVAGGSGMLTDLILSCKTNTFTGPVDAFIFSQTLTGTVTDNAAYNMAAADEPNLLGVAHLYDASLTGIGPVIFEYKDKPIAVRNTNSLTNLYVVLVARASITLGSTTDLNLTGTVVSN